LRRFALNEITMKRGRLSSADLAIIPFEPDVSPVSPPSNLKANERKLFCEIVASVPAYHFSVSDQYLLASFVRVTLVVDHAAKNLSKASDKTRPARMKVLDQAIKMQALLASKLRLTPQARVDSKVLARKHLAHRNGPVPWDENRA
jgi:hypothetical protein